MKLCLSGGHITPAIALAQYAHKMGDQVSLVGRRYTDARHTNLSQEASIAGQYGLHFFSLDPPKTPTTVKSLLTFLPLFIKSTFQVATYLRRTKPDCVISFGGYVGVPLILAARFLRLPILIHEQTLRPGIANKWASLLADHIAIGFPSVKKFFPAHKTTYTGNPLRQELYTKAPQPAWFKHNSKPLLFVTGGSQGSEFLTRLILDSLPELSTTYQLCLQTGQVAISPKPSHSLLHRQHLTSLEMAYMLQNAHLVISRAGANTISECLCVGVVTVCIPLPKSHSGEQQQNAAFLAKQGHSLTLLQDHANTITLLETIKKIESKYARYQKNAKASAMAYPRHVLSDIYALITQLCA